MAPDEAAQAGEQRQPDQEDDVLLRKGCDQQHDRNRADHGPDRAIPAFPQRRAEAGLAHHRGGASRPIGVVQLKRVGDEQSEAGGGGDTQAMQQARPGHRRRIAQLWPMGPILPPCWYSLTPWPLTLPATSPRGGVAAIGEGRIFP